MLDSTGRWSHWSGPVEFTTAPPAIPFPEQGDLRITEVHYNPLEDSEDLEFIELYNAGARILDLTAVSLTAGVEFAFAGSDVTSLEPGRFAVVVANRRAFTAVYGGLGGALAGEYRGRISNSGERIALTYGKNLPILEFTFDDGWYPETDGLGRSLVLALPDGPAASWSSAAGWKPSAAAGGSPGGADGPASPAGRQLPGDFRQDGRLNISDVAGLLRYLFVDGARRLPCGDGRIDDPTNRALLDASGDSAIDPSDAIHLLRFLFSSGPAPAAGRTCAPLPGCPDACP
jgi:hypothetical protein